MMFNRKKQVAKKPIFSTNYIWNWLLEQNGFPEIKDFKFSRELNRPQELICLAPYIVEEIWFN